MGEKKQQHVRFNDGFVQPDGIVTDPDEHDVHRVVSLLVSSATDREISSLYAR
jgi:hypothetical protein